MYMLRHKKTPFIRVHQDSHEPSDFPDPTKTKTLRQQYDNAFQIRWDKVGKEVNRWFNGGGVVNVEPNTSPAFGAEDNLGIFLAWVGKLENDFVLETDTALNPEWMDEFLGKAYLGGAVKGALKVETAAGFSLPEFEALAALNDPFFRDSLNVILEQNYAALRTLVNDFNGDLAQKMATTLAESMNTGLTPAETAKALQEVFNDRLLHVAKSRSTVISRTEIIRANTRATLNVFEKAGVKTVRTVLGGAPCPICIAINNQTWTLQEAFDYSNSIETMAEIGLGQMAGSSAAAFSEHPDWSIIPAHPQCVCDWIIEG